MRWLLLIGTLLSLALSFTRHTGGAMGLWLLLGIVGAFATALAFAQARIESHSRAETLSEYDLQRLRDGKPPVQR